MENVITFPGLIIRFVIVTVVGTLLAHETVAVSLLIALWAIWSIEVLWISVGLLRGTTVSVRGNRRFVRWFFYTTANPAAQIAKGIRRVTK